MRDSPRSGFHRVVLVWSLATLLTAWAGVAEGIIIVGPPGPPDPAPPPPAVQDSGLGPTGFTSSSNGDTAPAPGSPGPTFTPFSNGFAISGDTSLTSNTSAASLTVTLEGDLGLQVAAGDYYLAAGTGIFLGSSDSSVGVTSLSSFGDLLYYPSLTQVGGSIATVDFGPPVSNFYSFAGTDLPDYAGSGISNPFSLAAGDYTIQWKTEVTFSNVQAGDTLYIGLPGGGGLGSATPEPASFALWGLGATLIGGFTHWRRRRTNSAAGV